MFEVIIVESETNQIAAIARRSEHFTKHCKIKIDTINANSVSTGIP
jgi:hypothetical protein